jgi:fatty acid desaturase
MSTRARDITMLFAPDSDARRFTRDSMLCMAAIYASLGAAATGWLPPWCLAIVVALLVPRWMIALHELFHLRSEREVDPLTRFQPLLFTLLSLGYRENLVNHRSHHRFMATAQDAEYYQLRGSRLAGLVNAFTAPEQMWFRWVLEHGLERRVLVDTTLRALLLGALIFATGATFLWYWIPARLAFGASYFVFFYCLHRRGEAIGVYRLELPRNVVAVLAAVYGRDVVEATMHHDVHHAQPRVAARKLAASRAVLAM